MQHSLKELFRHRLYGIACGYADGNDSARLAEDPVMKMVLDRDPVSGAALASQPTLSRFENAPTAAELLRMATSWPTWLSSVTANANAKPNASRSIWIPRWIQRMASSN